MKKEKDYSKYFAPSIKDARKRFREDVKFIDFNLDPKYENLGLGLTYSLKTYGCQGNVADSEKIAGILEKMGFTYNDKEENANLIIFNTCAIRENAEERVFGELGRIRKYKKHNPNLIVGICGCMPQEEKTILAIKKKAPHLDLVLGTHNITSLPEYLYDVIKESKKVVEVKSIEGDVYENVPVKRDSDKKAWVNIMYGCDEFCTYCIVPYTRGKERSRHPEAIIKEVEELADNGYIEVTLLGQNVNAYGKDLTDVDYSFGDLLKDLNKTKIQRIRYTTSHPRDLDDKTIDAMALGGNIMPSLHLPVQSGNNEVLKRMNRKYTREEYLDKIKKLKEKVPGISITTDIIVAFPGETEKQFLDTLSLVKEVEYEGAYTFIYSPREGTPAATYENPLTEEQKHERLDQLLEVVNDYSYRGNIKYEGKVVEVLVEGFSKNKENMLTGYSRHNKLVNFSGDESLIGKVVNVKIEKAYSWHLQGIVTDQKEIDE